MIQIYHYVSLVEKINDLHDSVIGFKTSFSLAADSSISCRHDFAELCDCRNKQATGNVYNETHFCVNDTLSESKTQIFRINSNY